MNMDSQPVSKVREEPFEGQPLAADPKMPAEKLLVFPDVRPEILSNCTFYNSTSFSGDEDDSRFCSPKFSQLVLTEPSKKFSTLLPLEYVDPSSLSEIEIRELVNAKMRRLDLFNSKIMLKEQSQLLRKYKITPNQIEQLERLQRHIRRWIMKRKFFQAIRMNDYVESRKNFLMLKRCMEKFDKRLRKDYNSYYESLLDMLLI